MCAPNSLLSERERETGAGIIAVAHKYANHTVRRGQSGGGMASPLSTVRYAEDANLIEMADMEAGSHGGGVGYAATVMPIVATDATERERESERGHNAPTYGSMDAGRTVHMPHAGYEWTHMLTPLARGTRFLTGVVTRALAHKFELVLWRSLRGNLVARFSDTEEHFHTPGDVRPVRPRGEGQRRLCRAVAQRQRRECARATEGGARCRTRRTWSS
jgi:hypothetical protein